ncbi:hypothetical protein [Streptomyces scopuliridis]|uniref:hypothetical protein n=1 Tax=Streptomyces scopuliridis TaxID=452529 RepID=UPI00368EF00E
MRLTVTDGERQISIRALRPVKAAEVALAVLRGLDADEDESTDDEPFGFTADEKGKV